MIRGALLVTWVAAMAYAPNAVASTSDAGGEAGFSAEQVRMIQRALTERGFAVELSGKPDDQTKTAIGDFQRSRGMEVTGKMDERTASALGLDPAQVMPVRGATPPAEPKTSPDYVHVNTFDDGERAMLEVGTGGGE
jgi:peptidoglycan hydrolase-like protein with peptidoglycan-binding domain